MELIWFVLAMISCQSLPILLYIVTHHIRLQLAIKMLLTVINSGNGVGIKPMKDIKFSYLNIAHQMILDVFGRSKLTPT